MILQFSVTGHGDWSGNLSFKELAEGLVARGLVTCDGDEPPMRSVQVDPLIVDSVGVDFGLKIGSAAPIFVRERNGAVSLDLGRAGRENLGAALGEALREVNPTREQWIIGMALAGAVNACNAPFCGDNDADHVKTYIPNVAKVLFKHSSPMALEDAIQVLEAALALRTTAQNKP